MRIMMRSGFEQVNGVGQGVFQAGRKVIDEVIITPFLDYLNIAGHTVRMIH
jgi:hypothetical protein